MEHAQALNNDAFAESLHNYSKEHRHCPCVYVQASQPPEAGDSDEYKQTVEKLRGILDDRQGKYSFADIRVPLQSEEHGSLAAEAVVVAYR